MKRGNLICAIVLIGLIVTGIAALIYDIGSPTPIVLNEDATFSGYIQSDDDFRLHSIRVYANVTRIHCVLNCPGKDFDLYARLGVVPTLSFYNFRGYTSGGEDIYYDLPEAGIWHIMVHAYSGTGHYDLIIEFEYN